MQNLTKFILAAAIVIAAPFAVAMPATAGNASSPLGFKVFCLKHPDQCRASSKGTMQLTDERMMQLRKVNLAVNNSIRPVGERRGKDAWTLNASAGDCEDYVVNKRARLIKLGLPSGALRIAYAKTRRGQDHAVLIVRTNQGDFVLDNLTNAIRPISQSGLRIVSMSGTNPKKWSGV